jgi:hypothetical protein
MLERAARELQPFLGEIAFVGGAIIELWITDPAAPPPRVTKDVDVIVEVASRLRWHQFEERMRTHGLRHDTSSMVICRWRAGSPGDELLVDLMPSDASILGFDNRWQGPGLKCAKTLSLPSGTEVRAITPPYLIATKLEAWNGRGNGDHLRSHDLEDLIGVVDGRAELLGEVAEAPSDVRSFIAKGVEQLLDEPRFADLLDGSVAGRRQRGSTQSGENRVDEVVMPRLCALAEPGKPPV